MARSPKREVKNLVSNLLDRNLALAVSFGADHLDSQIYDCFSQDVIDVIDSYSNSYTLFAIVFDNGKSATLTVDYEWEDLDKSHLKLVKSLLKGYSRE